MSRLYLLVLLLLGLAACKNPSKSTPNLKIAVAANAQYAAAALTEAFEQEAQIATTLIVSSSGKLTAQIQQSAPYDLFLSADMAYPQYLFEEGQATSAPQVYAIGQLVLWTQNEDVSLDNPMEVLSQASIKRIAIAQARTAPYGQAAQAWLNHHALQEAVAAKLVFGESIAQVNSYVLSGVVDVGFTAHSVVRSPGLKGQGSYVVLAPDSYPSIEQGMVITKYGQANHPAATQLFWKFMQSAKAQVILREYGYQVPSGAAEN